MSQPSMKPPIPEQDDDREKSSMRENLTGARWFFNNDNPLWMMIPIILSILALWFAYKSNVINREWADVHLGVTTQVYRGWIDYEDYIYDDDVLHFQGTIGAIDQMEDLMGTMQLASNDLAMKWLAEAADLDPDDYSIEDIPFVQHFVFLAICNNGDQIAEDLYVKFDYYNIHDDLELRGEESIPEGIEPEEWEYGPALLPPDQWIMIPLCSCFIRLDPGSDEYEIKFMGDSYIPTGITYESAIGGRSEIPLDFENIPHTLSAFTEPPMPEEETKEEDGSGGRDDRSDDHSTGRIDRRD